MNFRRSVRLLPALLTMSVLAACSDPDTVTWRGVTMDAETFADWESTAIMGGPLRPAQAAYDVRHYDLDIAIHPDDKRVAGSNAIRVNVVMPLDVFEIPLDHRLELKGVIVDGEPAATATHSDNLVRVAIPGGWQPGETHVVTVSYAGKPFEALVPPWKDGWVWSHSADGSHWAGTTSQGSGGDLWWPVKDHPSDEPDEGMTITLDVPAGLVGLTNGRKLAEREENGRNITEWRVHYPINQYGVAITLGPFVPIETTYTRLDGQTETIIFWALPEHEEKARAMWLEQGPKILGAFAERFGEYPFWKDKYWVVETPYLGMEHQTIVAYGSDFEINDYGFDSLLLHETAHEWWGNKVSASDWADWWIHEGFGSYAHAEFVDVTSGKERYLEYMRERCSPEAIRGFRNPVIRGTDQVAEQAYVPEVYSKASCVIHTLRWLMEDEDFHNAVYRFQNDPAFAYRTATNRDFMNLVADIEGRPYDWFFDRYFWQTEIPRWTMTRDGETLHLAWDDPMFQLPIPVSVNGEMHRVDMTEGDGELSVPADAEVKVDPDGWLLALPAEGMKL
ncbi:MAG TPA: M1 family metallopeptidase [Gammaproteobacteria bacterium]